MPQREIHIFGKDICTGCSELTPKLRKLAKKYKFKFFEWDLDTIDGMMEGALIGVRSNMPLPQVFLTLSRLKLEDIQATPATADVSA